MAYWLMKSEPESYGWDDLVQEGSTEWTGVRNPTAALNMKVMRVGDRAFLYHSVSEKAVVGTMEIIRTAQQDGDLPRWVSVKVRPLARLVRPVTLAAIKADETLAAMELLRQSRLSIAPVRDAEWDKIVTMGGGTA